MKPSAATLLAAEMRAFVADSHAAAEWLEWARASVHRGVRCDVPLTGLPLLINLGAALTLTTVMPPERDPK